jgi:hypothetical protein
MTDKNDWLLFPHPLHTCMFGAHRRDHAKSNPTVGLRSADFGACFRVDFYADASTGRIGATVLQPDDNGRFTAVGPPITLLVASTVDRPVMFTPDFDVLRPCVVLGGQQRAVFRSG